MDKEKYNIQSATEVSSRHLPKLLKKSDAIEFQKMVPELRDTWTKKQMNRTETEMRFSVLNDAKYGTKAAKYWQSVREQNTHFENLMRLSFDYRTNDVEIKKLKRKIKKEKDDLEKELLEIYLDDRLFNKASMELSGRAHMREIKTWSRLKKEFNDGSFDTHHVNTHQLKSYTHTFENVVKTLTPHSSQPEIFNALGQLETLKRVAKSGELFRNEKTKALFPKK
jgi:hypothetical protein